MLRLRQNAAPRLTLAALAVALLLPVPSIAQYLETTISLGVNPCDILWNPTSNKVYVSEFEYGRVDIIDGVSNQLVARVSIPGPAGGLAWNSTENKVYCMCQYDDVIAVIDGVGDTLLSCVSVGDWPHDAEYCASGNKLYVASYDDRRIYVLDAHADTLVSSITFRGAPVSMLWHPHSNKLFCTTSGGDSVYVVDCRLDTLYRTIHLGRYSNYSIRNPVDDLLYFSGRDTLWALSPYSCSVVARIRVRGREMCAAPYPNKVMVAHDPLDTVYVLDCRTHVITSRIATWGGIAAMVCDTTGAKVYVACFAGSPSQNDTVIVLDGRSDTVVTAVAVGRDPWALAWNSTNSRIYAANRGSGTVSVIRDTSTAIAEPLGRRPILQAHATIISARYLHSGAGPADLVDAAGRKVMALVPGTNDLSSLPAGVYSVISPSTAAVRVLKLR